MVQSEIYESATDIGLLGKQGKRKEKKRKKEKDNEEGKEKERKKGREEGKEREKKALLIFWTYPNTMWSYRMYQSLFTNVLCSEL